MRAVLVLILVAACGDHGPIKDNVGDPDSAVPGAQPCTTRITYASSWIRPSGHPSDFDDADGFVSWDGTCTDDGANSYATLSNGWKPYFTGHQACAIALDTAGACGY